MTLREVARYIQEDLKQMVANVIIFKRGREWDFLLQWGEGTEYHDIKTIDPNAIRVNGYNNFAAFDLGYIQRQIQSIYSHNSQDPTKQ